MIALRKFKEDSTKQRYKIDIMIVKNASKSVETSRNEHERREPLSSKERQSDPAPRTENRVGIDDYY